MRPGRGFRRPRRLETVVEGPEDVAVGQRRGEHAVAAVPPQRAGEQRVVALVLVNEDMRVLTPSSGISWRFHDGSIVGASAPRALRAPRRRDRRVVEVVACGQRACAQAGGAEGDDMFFMVRCDKGLVFGAGHRFAHLLPVVARFGGVLVAVVEVEGSRRGVVERSRPSARR